MFQDGAQRQGVLMRCTAYESLRHCSGLDLNVSMRDVLLGSD